MTKIDLEQLMSVLQGLGLLDAEQTKKVISSLSEKDDTEIVEEKSNVDSAEFIINKNKPKRGGKSTKGRKKKATNQFDNFIKNLDKNATASERSELERASKFDKENPNIVRSRRRKFEKISATCRCCHKTEVVSPALCTKDTDGSIKYKCNSCSTRSCE